MSEAGWVWRLWNVRTRMKIRILERRPSISRILTRECWGRVHRFVFSVRQNSNELAELTDERHSRWPMMEDEMRKFLGFVILSLFASVAHAAAGGNIAGTVKGPDGAPFKAAFVRIQNMQTKMVTIVLSNARGKYL